MFQTTNQQIVISISYDELFMGYSQSSLDSQPFMKRMHVQVGTGRNQAPCN